MTTFDLSRSPTLSPQVEVLQRIADLQRRVQQLEQKPFIVTQWSGSTPPVAATDVPDGSIGFAKASKFLYLSSGGVWTQSPVWT